MESLPSPRARPLALLPHFASKTVHTINTSLVGKNLEKNAFTCGDGSSPGEPIVQRRIAVVQQEVVFCAGEAIFEVDNMADVFRRDCRIGSWWTLRRRIIEAKSAVVVAQIVRYLYNQFCSSDLQKKQNLLFQRFLRGFRKTDHFSIHWKCDVTI